jgi:hypothetical protein
MHSFVTTKIPSSEYRDTGTSPIQRELVILLDYFRMLSEIDLQDTRYMLRHTHWPELEGNGLRLTSWLLCQAIMLAVL